jgi:uncharacterized membrane protein YccC
MAVSMEITQAAFRPWGFPFSSWAFAIRIWIAAIVALYVSFWLQLEAPSSAMLTVAILAEPTRGQALEKAGYRLIATIIGVAAAIAITGLFSQTRDLLLLAFSAWLGLCVYVAGLLDGNRAYAGVLSGYTVAFLAAQQIDNPGHVFESSMARGAAIVIGIVSITFVNDLLSAPDRHPRLAHQLDNIHRRVRDLAKMAIRGGTDKPSDSAGLIAEIAALRPEIASLAVESSSGPVRSSAARNTSAALLAELHAARALTALPVIADATGCERSVAALDREVPLTLPAWRSDFKPDEGSALAWTLAELLRRDEQVRQNLAALRSDRRPPWSWRGPFYRSHRIAAENGLRAGVCFALAAVFFVWAGWSAASASFSLVAVIIGLGSVTPNPRAITLMALIASPIAVVFTGILEFVILDGATDFPLLAIALAPFVIGAALLIASPNRLLSALGRLNLIFVSAIFSPSNPQTYDPQSYLFLSLFVCVAAGILLAAQILVPPVSDDRRRKRLVSSARRELDQVPSNRVRRYAAEEEMLRDAARIGQIMAAGGAAPKNINSVVEALSHFDVSSMIRLCDDRLKLIVDSPATRLTANAGAALVNRNPHALRGVSRALRELSPEDRGVADLGSALAVTSHVIEAASARSSYLEKPA